MTTLKHFTSELANGSHREIRISTGILVLAFLGYSNVYSQNDKLTSSQQVNRHELLPAIQVPPKSETVDLILFSETEDNENRIEDDLAIDQERSDGIDMFLSKTNYRGSSKISFDIEFAQSGYTVVEVLDAASGTILDQLFQGPTIIGKKSFEINKKDFLCKNIKVLATHTSSSGQTIESFLYFELIRTDEIPLSLNERTIIDIKAQLLPTLGRGLFLITAQFMSPGKLTVRVHDMTGRLIETLYSGNVQQGLQSFEGNSSDWKSGNYIVSVETETGRWIQRMIVQ